MRSLTTFNLVWGIIALGMRPNARWIAESLGAHELVIPRSRFGRIPEFAFQVEISDETNRPIRLVFAWLRPADSRRPAAQCPSRDHSGDRARKRNGRD